MMLRIYLTFDVEDFINVRAIEALDRILKLLSNYKLRGLFFITGHFAEAIRDKRSIVASLENHLIGYHSSGHSVDPIIHKLTDLEDYDEAIRLSLIRERSYIDPLTGALKGEGGIISLRKIFPRNSILAFRAPGYAWSPPHLEALYQLGIRFDFSTAISTRPFIHKGISFYPFQAPQELLTSIRYLPYCLIFKKVLVFNWHPDQFVNRKPFDHFYYSGTPNCLKEVKSLPDSVIESRFDRFEQFIRRIAFLCKLSLIKTSPDLTESKYKLGQIDLQSIYERSAYWSRECFGFTPVFLYPHLKRFFGDLQLVT